MSQVPGCSGGSFGPHSWVRQYLNGNSQLQCMDVKIDDQVVHIENGQAQSNSGVDVRTIGGRVSDIYYQGQHADLRWMGDQLTDMYLDGNHLDMRYINGHVSDITTNGGHLDLFTGPDGRLWRTQGGCSDLSVETP